MRLAVQIVFGLLLVLSFSSFALEITPTERVHQSLSFLDDMSFENLDLAIDRQLRFYSRGLTGQIKFGTKVYNKSVLKDSLLLLKSLAATARDCQQKAMTNCQAEFNRKVNESFAIYRPVSKEKNTHFTSYYSPDMHGARTRTEVYKHAIYRMPDAPHANYTRVEIDYKGALEGKGYEIFWVKESFYDLYLLHVQGGGRITIENANGLKEIKYLSYNGKNSRTFQMIYKYMLERGYLTSGNAGIPAQRRFLEENPHKQEEIFGTCPSYIYFKESDEEPVGLDNIPLTEGRSVALDRTIYKTTGLINFVKTVKASHLDENHRVVKVPFTRFFIGQDTGGAIKGPARCDLYFGYGPQAELAAYNMNEMGEQYFLVKK